MILSRGSCVVDRVGPFNAEVSRYVPKVREYKIPISRQESIIAWIAKRENSGRRRSQFVGDTDNDATRNWEFKYTNLGQLGRDSRGEQVNQMRPKHMEQGNATIKQEVGVNRNSDMATTQGARLNPEHTWQDAEGHYRHWNRSTWGWRTKGKRN